MTSQAYLPRFARRRSRRQARSKPGYGPNFVARQRGRNAMHDPVRIVAPRAAPEIDQLFLKIVRMLAVDEWSAQCRPHFRTVAADTASHPRPTLQVDSPSESRIATEGSSRCARRLCGKMTSDRIDFRVGQRLGDAHC